MTIPTAGSHPEVLAQLVDDSGIPKERVVIIATKSGLTLPDGVIVVNDFGAPNIQRWWNKGINEAAQRGATAVAVVNDDIGITPETLPQMYRKLVETGATIASPSRPPAPDGVRRRPLVPYEPRLWGALWMLDLSTSLRPDERYVWWYGDSDLDIRARRDFAGVVNVNVEYEHFFPGLGTSKSTKLQEQSVVDARTFQQDYARILTLTRWVNKIRKSFVK